MANMFFWVFLMTVVVQLSMIIESTVITTLNGRIKGYTEMIDGITVDIYLGVPFGTPPVGDLRFKAPQPVQNWTGILETTTQPNSCMQSLDTSFDRFSGVETWNTKTNRSEDCLYLNIWVPKMANNQSKLPVMLWFYGGSYVTGSITLDVYDGRYLAAKNNVIVASMQYRVGVHGFLYTGTEDAPGNMGLLDQQLAMKWIYENIAYFGGDENRICLFGESSGAASISHHLLAPSSWPYFNNAILMSASSLAHWAVDTSLNLKIQAYKFAKIMNCPQSWSLFVECLRNKSAEELETKQWELSKNIGTFSPVIDGNFLPDDPLVLLNSGKIKDANIMAGITKDEGEYFLIYFYQDYFLPERLWNPAPLNRSSFLELVSRIIESRNQLKTDAVLYTYEKSLLESERGDYTDILDDLLGDTYFKCPVRDFCGMHSKLSPGKGQGYLYSFDYRSSVNPWPSWMGSLHGYEIESVFGLPFNPGLNYSDSDRNISEYVMTYMTNFAKTGDPNSNGVATYNNDLPVWRPFDLSEEIYISFSQNSGPIARHEYRRRECTFWSDLAPKIENTIQHCSVSSTEATSTRTPLTLLLTLLYFISYLV